VREFSHCPALASWRQVLYAGICFVGFILELMVSGLGLLSRQGIPPHGELL